MKAYTNIEQSKKLEEILPLESADMCYIQVLLAGAKYGEYIPYIGDLIPAYGQDKIKCWSLAALLDYLRKVGYFPDILVDEHSVEMSVTYFNNEEGKILHPLHTILVKKETFIDACVEMIIKLKEQKLL